MMPSESRRFRLSVRSLMIAVAICALFLVPAIWLIRQNEQIRAIEAERARYVIEMAYAQTRSVAGAPVTVNPPDQKSPAQKRSGVWAALSVNHSAFSRSGVKGFIVEFTLVNDSEVTIDPKIAESRIMVNGKELADSGLLLSNGPRGARFAALPPGEQLRFSNSLGDYFKEPGIYRVLWRGENFRSQEVVFRVLPDERN
jgi:hypothetical protein